MRLRASGALGRSQRLLDLFDYLAKRTAVSRPPKEVEIAMDVFGRPADFDAMQDAVVRVYVHKLRQRLAQAYAEAPDHTGMRLAIPRGEYKLVAQAEVAEEEAPPTGIVLTPARLRRWIAAACAVLVLAVAVTWLIARPQPTVVERELAAVRRSPAWSPLFNNRKVTIVALGDYYIFGESDDGMSVSRLVREYNVNSRPELDEFLMQHPDKMSKYLDLDLRYLPIGAAQALRDVAPILTPVKSAADVRVMMVSDLTPGLLKSANIVYIGYLSGLGILKDVAFSSSRFRIGETFDDIIDQRTKKRFASEGGAADQPGILYRDYGYVSSFRGPEGNRIVIVAGTRDVALMQTADIVSRVATLDETVKAAGKADSFEALYEVHGMNRQNVSGQLITASPLDSARMWRTMAP
ncbi:hypothetical protein BH09PSE2_BH09PSE2_10470 [soil metagenome]